MSNLALFDADRTVATQCPHCPAIRQPGQDRAPQCEVDTQRQSGAGWVARPQTCLNHPQPEHDPFPEGF